MHETVTRMRNDPEEPHLMIEAIRSFLQRAGKPGCYCMFPLIVFD
ncbi:hypothetical protein T190_16350 [Sinorhizobium meliloti CCBAU 01290]|nr:hypothetical protein T190_16350 [Sinorhizobium meliloti CCBAU 01290]